MRKSSNFKYFVSEGCKSYAKNTLMTLSSTIIVVACLLVFGIYLLFSMNINFVAEQLKAECEIRVYVDTSIEPGTEKMEALEKSIKSVSNIKSVEFYSNEKALEDYKDELGDDAYVMDGFGDDNPLRDSFKIKLEDLSLSGSSAEKLSKIEGIANVSDNQSSANKLVNVTNIIKSISFWFMIFLGALAIFIISNTIKITLFARRRDINIMKYLGATNSFISWPYIIEGIVIGFVGSLVAMTIMLIAYKTFLAMDITLFEAMQLKFCGISEVILPLMGWFIGIGVLLGAVGSAVSIRRHLKV